MLHTVPYNKKELAEIESKVDGDIRRLHVQYETENAALERRRRKLLEDQAYLQESKLTLLKTGAYTPEAFLEEERNLVGEIDKTIIDQEDATATMSSLCTEVISISERLSDALLTYKNAHIVEKENVARIIVSELLVDENTAKIKLTPGFKPFETRFVSNCAPAEWLSELLVYQEDIQEAKLMLERINRKQRP